MRALGTGSGATRRGITPPVPSSRWDADETADRWLLQCHDAEMTLVLRVGREVRDKGPHHHSIEDAG